jgi:hypothetical protein
VKKYINSIYKCVHNHHLHFTSLHRHSSIFQCRAFTTSSPLSHYITEFFQFTSLLVWYNFMCHSIQIISNSSQCILITFPFLLTVLCANSYKFTSLFILNLFDRVTVVPTFIDPIWSSSAGVKNRTGQYQGEGYRIHSRHW